MPHLLKCRLSPGIIRILLAEELFGHFPGFYFFMKSSQYIVYFKSDNRMLDLPHFFLIFGIILTAIAEPQWPWLTSVTKCLSPLG